MDRWMHAHIAEGRISLSKAATINGGLRAGASPDPSPINLPNIVPPLCPLALCLSVSLPHLSAHPSMYVSASLFISPSVSLSLFLSTNLRLCMCVWSARMPAGLPAPLLSLPPPLALPKHLASEYMYPHYRRGRKKGGPHVNQKLSDLLSACATI